VQGVGPAIPSVWALAPVNDAPPQTVGGGREGETSLFSVARQQSPTLRGTSKNPNLYQLVVNVPSLVAAQWDDGRFRASGIREIKFRHWHDPQWQEPKVPGGLPTIRIITASEWHLRKRAIQRRLGPSSRHLG
jgi:hypothetical protein